MLPPFKRHLNYIQDKFMNKSHAWDSQASLRFPSKDTKTYTFMQINVRERTHVVVCGYLHVFLSTRHLYVWVGSNVCASMCVCVSISCSIQMSQMLFRGAVLHVACCFGPVRTKMRETLICPPILTHHRE